VGLWERFRKHRAIRSYLREAPQALLGRYGYLEHHSPQQVRATLVATRLDTTHVYYAYAVLCAENAFVERAAERRGLERPPTRDACRKLYRALRLELAEDHNGGRDFSFKPPDRGFEQGHSLRCSAYNVEP
jgi:hypothetical protein